MPRRPRPLLTELSVANYKSLREIRVPLAPLNVLVGPNGAGKSNLIGVVAFLRDALADQATEALAARGGFETVRFHGASARRLIFRVEGTISRYSSAKAPDEYTLTLNLLKSGRISRVEELVFKRTEGAGTTHHVEGPPDRR